MRNTLRNKVGLLPMRPSIDPGLGRRDFLIHSLSGLLILLGGGLLGVPAWASGALKPPILQRPKDLNAISDFEQLHVPRVRMPEMIEDGANAPCFIEMDHPMEPDHYITSVQILDYADPIIWKGTWHFTPASGRVYVYTQLRLDSGPSTVYAIATCNQHGAWVGTANVNVAIGGC